ncbi:MAG: GxxExxY protein [Planctomycetota bacterium]
MKRFDEEIEKYAYEFIGAAIEVHRQLGPGFLEIVYANALEIELQKRGIGYVREYAFHIYYDGDQIVGKGRCDFFIENRLVVELKAVEHMPKIYWHQVTHYLRRMNEPLGLLVNFCVETLNRGGINRVING